MQPSFTAGPPRQLFEADYVLNDFPDAYYDVSPDGDRLNWRSRNHLVTQHAGIRRCPGFTSACAECLIPASADTTQQ
jgi:hypothetical protein